MQRSNFTPHRTKLDAAPPAANDNRWPAPRLKHVLLIIAGFALLAIELFSAFSFMF